MASGYHFFFSFVSQSDCILSSYRQGHKEGGGEPGGLQQPNHPLSKSKFKKHKFCKHGDTKRFMRFIRQ
jgi:hypothetical protein